MSSFTEMPPGFVGHGSDDDDEEDLLVAPHASANKDIDQNHVNELASLIRRKQREGFREYLHSVPKPDVHLDANVSDMQRNSVMHLVVLSADIVMLKEAVECGGSVNLYENDDGETPLTLAAQIFPDGFVLMLHTAKKLRAKRINSRGQSLLHSVVTAKATARPWPDRVAVVRELLTDHKLSIKQQDNLGNTPCAWARQHYLGLGNDGETVIDLLSKSQSKRMNASKAEFVAFYKSPVARLLFVVILIVLHCIQYATETYDRPPIGNTTVPTWYEVWPNGTENVLGEALPISALPNEIRFNLTVTPYPLTDPNGASAAEVRNVTNVGYILPPPQGRFPFWFMVMNMVGSNWYAPTKVIAAHIGTLFLGVVLGAALVMLLIRDALGKQLLSLRIFGADADRAGLAVSGVVSDDASTSLSFMVDSFDHPASTHGTLYMIVAGVVSGLYCGALVLNELLETSSLKDDGGAAFLVKPTIGNLDSVQLLRAAWVISLMVDWFLLILVFDTMIQLLSSNNAAVPDPAYNGFGAGLYVLLPTWRRIWWFGATLLGWLGIFIAYGVRSRVKGNMAFVAPLIDTSSQGQQLAVVSLSILFTFMVVSQDWTLPYRRHTVELVMPFCSEARSNLMWLLWFVCSVTMALDMRLFVALLWRFVDEEDLSGPLKRFELAMAILPCAVGVVLFIVVLIRTSTRVSGGARRGVEDETRSQSAAGGNALPFRSSEGRTARQQTTSSPVDKSGGGAAPFASVGSAANTSATLKRPVMKASMIGSNRVFDENAPARPPSSSLNRKAQANDIWSAAAADDVVKLCTLLEKDPNLVNQRGGPGIECDGISRTVTVMPPGSRAGAEYGAAPIHYAIACGARATLTALLSRGANTRLRTVHGMFSCRELIDIVGNKELRDAMFPPVAEVATATGASPSGAIAPPRKGPHRATPRGGEHANTNDNSGASSPFAHRTQESTPSKQVQVGGARMDPNQPALRLSAADNHPPVRRELQQPQHVHEDTYWRPIQGDDEHLPARPVLHDESHLPARPPSAQRQFTGQHEYYPPYEPPQQAPYYPTYNEHHQTSQPPHYYTTDGSYQTHY